MKGLYRYLSPFSPDQSGAVAVLYELGGIIVILDAGGCAGNICGFDEPRWGHKQSAVYSAGIRDLGSGRERELHRADRHARAGGRGHRPQGPRPHVREEVRPPDPAYRDLWHGILRQGRRALLHDPHQSAGERRSGCFVREAGTASAVPVGRRQSRRAGGCRQSRRAEGCRPRRPAGPCGLRRRPGCHAPRPSEPQRRGTHPPAGRDEADPAEPAAHAAAATCSRWTATWSCPPRD